MTLPDLSVKRPVFAAVAAIVLVVVGLAAYFSLSVRELPSVDPPQVSVSTNYRGASAEVVEERITQVIERQVSGIQGIDRVNSSSRDGASRINITFTLDRDLDAAANDVRDAVSRVSQQLPEQADAPQIAKANADASPIMFLSLTSTSLDRLQLSDYADRYLIERMSTIPGVATVGMFGAQNYAMRVWLDPAAMAARGVTVDDVQNALNSQNVELPAGALESPAKDYTIRVNRQYVRPSDFALMPITVSRSAAGAAATTATRSANPQGPVVGGLSTSASSGSPTVVRLGDVARIEEGPDERRRLFRSNGVEQIGIAITRQAQANDLEISKGVKAEVDSINRSLPAGTKIAIAVDYSVFTAEAIHEVWVTMVLSLILVAAVNFLFLGSWRAALIPTLVAPICILASFIALAPLGFSLNLLTLLALVLAIGLVVDDAIVVVENIQRRIDEEGEPPIVAAQRGANQVFFAVVATTLVLLAVFVPLMVLPGYIGRLFVELAVAVAAAIFFSALMALTLSPMLASKILRPSSGGGWLARHVDRATEALKNSYKESLELLTSGRAFSWITGATVAVLALVAVGLFVALPKETVPNEDRGRVDINISGPEGAGYDYTLKALKAAEPRLQKLVNEGTAARYTLGVPRFGGNQFNTGFGNLVLVPWDERKVTADDLASQLNREFQGITSARVIASVRGPFQRGGGGGGGGNSVDFIAVGNDYDDILAWVEPIFRAAQENPGLGRPRLDYEPTSPRLLVNIDRDKAAALGVSAQSVGAALETMFGSRRATTYIKNGQEYDVLLQTQLEQRRTEEDLKKVYVRTGAGAMTPLSNVVRTEVRGDTPDRRRVDRVRAITLSAELNPGYTVADGVRFFEQQARAQPAAGMSVKWGGAAKDYLEASNSVAFAFGGALLLVFLVLAAQFESWIHPAVIMLTVPLAALGGLFGLLLAGSTLNTYSQIGLIILVGIAAKNGILIVEFANQLRDEGRPIREAVIEAAALRLRPIIMTSIAAAFGALPLILAAGPGAGSRKTIGVVIFTGAIFATLLTLFVVPVFYNLLARFTKSPEWTAKQIEKYEEEEAKGGLHPDPRPAE
jgi:multidrug efflux pump